MLLAIVVIYFIINGENTDLIMDVSIPLTEKKAYDLIVDEPTRDCRGYFRTPCI